MISALQMNVVPFSAVLTRNSGASGVPMGLDALHHLVEVEGRMERLDLRHQVVDEPLARHHGKARNVVDRLLGIELGALAADLRQDVDEMAFDVEEAEFEHGEQAHRPCADDDDVGFDIVGHEQAPSRRPSESTVSRIWQCGRCKAVSRRRARA